MMQKSLFHFAKCHSITLDAVMMRIFLSELEALLPSEL